LILIGCHKSLYDWQPFFFCDMIMVIQKKTCRSFFMIGNKCPYRLSIIIFIFFFSFLFVTLFVQTGKIEKFDLSIIHFVQGFETPLLTSIMLFFTKIGSFPIVTLLFLLISLFLYFVFHHRSELVLFAVVIAGTLVINRLLKEYFERVRPDIHRLIEIGGYSFPSGHAMTAFSVYTILAFLFWRHISTRFGRIMLLIFSALFIFMIGISRIYLGVHYPSDILGGYFVSGMWCTLAIGFFQKYKNRNHAKD